MADLLCRLMCSYTTPAKPLWMVVHMCTPRLFGNTVEGLNVAFFLLKLLSTFDYSKPSF